jgi:large subunit ribosomal protein L9
MKVILLKDVPKVGQRHDVKDFADGYAQNVLINKGLAMRATPAELAKLAERKAQQANKQAEEDKKFKESLDLLNQKFITIKINTNEKGHLFKAISALDIAKAIKESTNLLIDERNIQIDNVIKEVGNHPVIIKNGDKAGKINISVESK